MQKKIKSTIIHRIFRIVRNRTDRTPTTMVGLWWPEFLIEEEIVLLSQGQVRISSSTGDSDQAHVAKVIKKSRCYSCGKRGHLCKDSPSKNKDKNATKDEGKDTSKDKAKDTLKDKGNKKTLAMIVILLRNQRAVAKLEWLTSLWFGCLPIKSINRFPVTCFS